jgi:hypothetical protein
MIAFASSLLVLGGVFQAVSGRTTRFVPRDGTSPSLPYDENSTKYCSWWIDYTVSTSCPTLLTDNYITLEAFRRWVSLSRLTDRLVHTNSE